VNSPADWLPVAILILVASLVVAGFRMKTRALVRARLFAAAFVLMGVNGLAGEAIGHQERRETMAALTERLQASAIATRDRAAIEGAEAEVSSLVEPRYVMIIVHAAVLLMGLTGVALPKLGMTKEARLNADAEEAVAKGRRKMTPMGTGTTA